MPRSDPTHPTQTTAAVAARLRPGYSEGAGIYRIVPASAIPIDTVRTLTSQVRSAPLIPRGAGSGMAGGNIGSGIALDLTTLRDLRIDAASHRAAAGAGVTCRQLNEAAASHGLRFAPEPSSAGFATFGGMTATNAAGARSFAHGPIRDWILGLSMVTSDGEVCTLDARSPHSTPDCQALQRFNSQVVPALRQAAPAILDRFPKVRKNTAGYGLDAWLETGSPLDLIIGSEGTLGIITEVILRLEPTPPATGGLRAAVTDDAALTAALEILRESGAVAIEFLDHSFLRFVADTVPEADRDDARHAHALLLVEFEGSAGLVAERLANAANALEPVATGIRTATDATELDALWEIRHAASPILARLSDGRRSLQVIEDGCVPPERFAEYLRGIRAITREEEVDAVLFGHAGDAHLHVNLLPDLQRAGWTDRLRRIFRRATDLQIGLGGTTAGEHGVGRLRSTTLEQQYGPEIVDLMRAVKDAFDPRGILNPGVIFPEPGWDPISHLKVGDDAEPIPPGIAAALREVEMTGGYSRNRMELAREVMDRGS